MLGKTFGRSTGTGTVDLFYLLTLTILLPLQVESGKPLVKVEGEEPQGSGEQGEAMEVNSWTCIYSRKHSLKYVRVCKV